MGIRKINALGYFFLKSNAVLPMFKTVKTPLLTGVEHEVWELGWKKKKCMVKDKHTFWGKISNLQWNLPQSNKL